MVNLRNQKPGTFTNTMVLITLKFGNLGLVFVCLIYFDLVLRKKIILREFLFYT